jgi:hypothetical protein
MNENKELPFTPTFKPLSKMQMTDLMKMALLEQKGSTTPEEPTVEDGTAWVIIWKRITVMELPIKFTSLAKWATLLFIDRPGAAVLFLIDCLNKYEGQEVTVRMLCELYPYGFYDEESMIKIIDEEIKTHKMKWSQIY